jgi:Trk-type K+ transport system membrane component
MGISGIIALLYRGSDAVPLIASAAIAVVVGAAMNRFTVASPLDAFFESISGFTTTGASIFPNPQSLPRGILFWRDMSQWLGGMGIIVLVVAVLPFLGVGGMQLFRAEVPGPTPERLRPRIRQTATILWRVYVGLTAAQVVRSSSCISLA